MSAWGTFSGNGPQHPHPRETWVRAAATRLVLTVLVGSCRPTRPTQTTRTPPTAISSVKHRRTLSWPEIRGVPVSQITALVQRPAHRSSLVNDAHRMQRKRADREAADARTGAGRARTSQAAWTPASSPWLHRCDSEPQVLEQSWSPSCFTRASVGSPVSPHDSGSQSHGSSLSITPSLGSPHERVRGAYGKGTSAELHQPVGPSRPGAWHGRRRQGSLAAARDGGGDTVNQRGLDQQGRHAGPGVRQLPALRPARADRPGRPAAQLERSQSESSSAADANSCGVPLASQAFASFFPGLAPPVVEALFNLYKQLLKNIEENALVGMGLGA